MAATPLIDWSADDRLWPELVSKVAQGDERALAQLYDATSRIVYGLALRITADRSAAEDITLEVYLQVWRTTNCYDPDRGTVSSWLVVLARSRSIDWLRTRRARHSRLEQPLEFSDLPDPQPSPELNSIDAGRARFIRNALAELADEQRLAIELAYFSALTHTEIASRIGVPLGTVKTRIRLGMLRLRELLQPYMEAL